MYSVGDRLGNSALWNVLWLALLGASIWTFRVKTLKNLWRCGVYSSGDRLGNSALQNVPWLALLGASIWTS